MKPKLGSIALEVWNEKVDQMEPKLKRITPAAWESYVQEANSLKRRIEAIYRVAYDTLDPRMDARLEKLWDQYMRILTLLGVAEPEYMCDFLRQGQREAEKLEGEMEKALEQGERIDGLIVRYNLLTRLLEDAGPEGGDPEHRGDDSSGT